LVRGFAYHRLNEGAMAKYKRAPITEAVIEIRLAAALPKEMVDAIHTRLRRKYPNSMVQNAERVKLDMKERQVTFDEREQQYRLSSLDQTDILLITRLNVVCSRLAPYESWEAFQPRAVDDWNQWKQVVGYQKIARLGIRYINRIDIPIGENSKVDVEEYLKVVPQYPEPEVISSFDKYTMQITSRFGKENFSLIVNTSTVPSPLVDHLSIAFDLDIGMTENVPQRDDTMWAAFDVMREHKNRLFEACITDKARELFNS
jgi:uncharacterized protein (TIGR04255 family)